MVFFATIGLDGADLQRPVVVAALHRRWSLSANRWMKVWPTFLFNVVVTGSWARAYVMVGLENYMHDGEATSSFLQARRLHITVLMMDFDSRLCGIDDVLAELSALCLLMNTFSIVQCPTHVCLLRWTRNSWNYAIDPAFSAWFDIVRQVCIGLASPLREGCQLNLRDPHLTWC